MPPVWPLQPCFVNYRNASNDRICTTSSFLRPGGEDRIEFTMRRGGLGEAERAPCLHLARRGEEGPECSAREGAADADALDAHLAQVLDGERYAFHPHQYIDRPVDFLDDGFDIFPRLEAGRIENIGTGILESLQSHDRVGEIGPVMQEILR